MKLIAAVGFLLVAAVAAAQPVTEERKKYLRSLLESDFEQQTKEQLETFMREVRARKNENSPELPVAIRGIKMMLYNTAYNRYRCILENPTSTSEAQACFVKAMREMNVSFKLVTQYTAAVAPRSSRCEMQARLFDAELEFPPFPFFGDDVRLFDHARMAECLRQ